MRFLITIRGSSILHDACAEIILVCNSHVSRQPRRLVRCTQLSNQELSKSKVRRSTEFSASSTASIQRCRSFWQLLHQTMWLYLVTGGEILDSVLIFIDRHNCHSLGPSSITSEQAQCSQIQIEIVVYEVCSAPQVLEVANAIRSPRADATKSKVSRQRIICPNMLLIPIAKVFVSQGPIPLLAFMVAVVAPMMFATVAPWHSI